VTVNGANFDPDGAAVFVKNSGSSTPFECTVSARTTDRLVCSYDTAKLAAGSVEVQVVSFFGKTEWTVAGAVSADALGPGATAGISVAVIVVVVGAIAVTIIVIMRRKLTDIKGQITEVPDEMQHIFNIKSTELEIISKLGEGRCAVICLTFSHNHFANDSAFGAALARFGLESLRSATLPSRSSLEA
jgi:hypothetical protein